MGKILINPGSTLSSSRDIPPTNVNSLLKALVRPMLQRLGGCEAGAYLEPAARDHGYANMHSRPTYVRRGDYILVHAYEDRTDLLQSLIIGPENMPYEDTPFVIDWMLDSNFPQSRPIVHFLSWTNGNGHVNLLLFAVAHAEQKSIRRGLSILGTWAGGLWFCEPTIREAVRRRRGHRQQLLHRLTALDSRLYNEKAYILSRGFVQHALESLPGGLEPGSEFLYHGIVLFKAIH
ncbi:hypothetical protein DFH07DRAFT_779388 [Mycena maculata]|uniref:Uncharacterized protein n=1 Tax=Mycena maculata TaxID=230809 RepID=A0AAD7MY21_9AGAR|nr:hypothetical protein DFH07DRAFT_779388 [Mycena maculata]